MSNQIDPAHGDNVEKDSLNPQTFGGCNRLLFQYKTIGSELLLVETTGSVAAFREGVCFVPVEVLESYLEDLLELSVNESTLNILRASRWFHSQWMKYWVAKIKKLIPQLSLMRRMHFARIVSAEIARRRGKDGTTRTPILAFDKMLGSGSAGGVMPSGGLQGAARAAHLKRYVLD